MNSTSFFVADRKVYGNLTSVNLVTQPWIPVIDASGAACHVSLREVFARGLAIRDLALRPHERVALMRLLLCIAQRALQRERGLPRNVDDAKTAARELPALAVAYLEQWQCAFNLFDAERPFLQFAGLAKPPKPAKKTGGEVEAAEDDESLTPASKLDFALATGNNPTLFDNAAAAERDRVFEPARLAVSLLTFQCFSPGGRIGVALWKGALTPGAGSSGHAPCSPSAMLHAFLRGDSLLATVIANVVTLDAVRQIYGRQMGVPVWERFPTSFADTEAVENATKTFLGRLVPVSRAILLHGNGAGLLLANGLDYPTPPDFEPEPSATLISRSDGQGSVLLGAASGKALWRDLHALAVKRRLGQAGGPLALAEFDGSSDVDLWTGALVTDKASILDAVESVYRIPLRMFSEPGRVFYEQEVRHSEIIATALGNACKSYRRLLEIKPPGYPEQRAAHQLYWTTVEQHAYLLLEHLRANADHAGDSQVLSNWRRVLWDSAFRALADACPDETPRQRRAYALARHELQVQRRKIEQKFPISEPAVP